MDRINAQLNRNWKDQRRNDDQKTRWLHELPTNQQDNIDDHQEHNRSKTCGQHGAGNMLRDLLIRQYVLEDQRIGDDEHQRHCEFSRLKQCFAGVFVHDRGWQIDDRFHDTPAHGLDPT